MAKVKSKDQMEKMENRNNVFIKLDEGDYKIRVISDIEYVLQHKVEVDGKTRFFICPTEMARIHNENCNEGEQVEIPTCPLCENGIKTDLSYLAFALVRFDSGKFEVGLLNKNSILKEALNLEFDPDFGDIKGIDLKVNATGEGLKRRYKVNPLPKDKSIAFSEEEQKAIDEFNSRFELSDFCKPAEEVVLTAVAKGEEIPF